MAGVTISQGVRANLISLQQTANLMSETQNRLATGKKVNSALDNPNSFFTAAALNDRANDLSTLLDDMGQAVQTLKAADEGIKSITTLVEAAKAKANQAAQTSSTTDRAKFASEYNDLLSQIEGIANDSGYKGKNLLAGDSLVVTFNEKTGADKNTMSITGVSYGDASTGLSLSEAADWTADDAGDTAIETTLTSLTSALTTLRNQASTFGTNLTVVENRQNFTKNMINTLQEGGDKLVNADSNEEGAKLLALQTRQSLASTALSLASQAEQNVLRLF